MPISRFVAVCFLGVVACESGGPAASSSATTSATAAPPAVTTKKKLTKAELDEAKAIAKPFAPWAETHAAVTAKIGAHHSMDGDNYVWTAVEGDKCAQLSVEKKGAEVGSVGVSEYDKMMKSAYEKCAALSP